MIKLTNNFSLSEFTRSQTAENSGVDNTPNAFQLENLKLLAASLQVIRDKIGVPVTISSGFRSEALNRLVKGSPTSAHSQGLAADIHASDYSAKEFAQFIDGCGVRFDQLILERVNGKEWVHLGIGGLDRRQVLTFDGRSYTSGLN